MWVSPSNSVGTGALINQVWGSVEWKMGANGEKEWNTRFLLLNADYTEWVWAKVKTVGDKPLRGHTMKLVVERLEVTSTDAQNDLSSLVTNFITLPGDLSDAGEGVYKGQITLKQSDNFRVENFKMSFEDQGVYLRSN